MRNFRFLLFLLLMPCTASNTFADNFEEYEIKAVYLLNFASFVFWPDRALEKKQQFTICVLGTDPFGESLDITVENETVAGLPVHIQRLSNPQQAQHCQIVFFSQALVHNEQVLSALKQQPVLTISDQHDFFHQGGMIEFFNSHDNQVRFKVALQLIQQARLQISTDLLEIADSVE